MVSRRSSTARCRICGHAGARSYEFEVRIGPGAHVWRLLTCRDCWRTFEAMLDEGAHAQQYALSNQDGQRPTWVW